MLKIHVDSVIVAYISECWNELCSVFLEGFVLLESSFITVITTPSAFYFMGFIELWGEVFDGDYSFTDVCSMVSYSAEYLAVGLYLYPSVLGASLFEDV